MRPSLNAISLRWIPAIFMLAACGCATSFELKSPFKRAASSGARLAASDASGEYPVDIAARDSALTALLQPEAKTVRVINPTDQTYTGVRVWIDQEYVAWVNVLPARGVARLAMNDFYDADGNPLSAGALDVRRFELHTDGELLRVMGPVVEMPPPSNRRGVRLQFPPPRN